MARSKNTKLEPQTDDKPLNYELDTNEEQKPVIEEKKVVKQKVCTF